MENFLVPRADIMPSCRDRKHSGRRGMVTGLICSIGLIVSLLAEPQDSPSHASTSSQEALPIRRPAWTSRAFEQDSAHHLCADGEKVGAFRNIHMKRTNRILVSRPLAAFLCSTGLRHTIYFSCSLSSRVTLRWQFL